MLVLKQVYHVALRQTQGLMMSLLRLLGVDQPTASYSTLSRRTSGLGVVLPRQKASEHLHVVIDATGLKVYGEGEWKVRQHGISKRRTWRKLHLAFDEASQEVLACEVTDGNRQEKIVLPKVLAQIAEPIDQASLDGAYDFMSCYEDLSQRQARIVIPPRQNAALRHFGVLKARDAIIGRIAEIGRTVWKQESGYHRRSLAETGMFRLKTIFGDRLSSRLMPQQITEARLRCAILNRMTALGMPDSYPVA
jgi:hypothetical protein